MNGGAREAEAVESGGGGGARPDAGGARGAADVVVLMPDGRERFALAAAFAPDRLLALVTTLWTPPDRAPWRWLGEGVARRRWHGDVAGDRVVASSWSEVARLVATRVVGGRGAWGARASAALVDWRNRVFDRRARRVVEAMVPPPEVVVGHPSCWLESLRACRARGIRTVVVLPLAHPATVRAIAREAAARRPAWTSAWDLAARSAALERRVEEELALADVVVCPSAFVVESCVAAGLPREKLRLVPYGAEVERFAEVRRERTARGVAGEAAATPSSSSPSSASSVVVAAAAEEAAASPVRFLFAGYLSQRKGIGTLLEAFARLPRGAATLDLAGAWHGGAAGRAVFAPLLGDGVRERGFLRGEAFVAALRDADIFVLPSLCEGSALVTYEALAAGVPLITTPSAGSLLDAGDAGEAGSAPRDDQPGVLVAPDDVDALAGAMTAALDLATRARWTAAALARTPRSWADYRADLRRVVGPRA